MKKLKTILMNIAKRNLIFRKIFRNSLNTYRYIRYKIKNLGIKVDEKTVLFSTFEGKSYADSSKAIYLYMKDKEKFKDYKFIWVLKEIENHKFLEENRNTILVKRGTKEYEKYLAKAKYWIFNHRVADYIYPNRKQVYLQCWHGTPLKRLGCDLEKTDNALNTTNELKNKYITDAKKFTHLISPSEFATEKFISSFNLKELKKENCIIEKGYPRNDFLYSYTKNDIKTIKEKLKIENINKKIILYAPTWRDNQHQAGVGYTYKTEVDFDLFQKELGQDYIILFRAHYFIANKFDFEKYKGFIYDVSKVDDINELYIIADMLITDYSSVFFDYANLKRPIIFYMYDLDMYANNMRGFYIDLKELPGNIVKTEKELIENIKEVSNNFKYNEKYKKFNEKYNYLDDGKASERVVNVILNERSMNVNNNYIWLFGENLATTANNNSYYFWKKIVNVKDNIDKYLILEKNLKNKELYKALSKYEKQFILWKNSIRHFKIYFKADMFFVTLSYLDIMPTKIFFYDVKFKIKKPVIYLQHGTICIKKLDYTGSSYNNNLFRFCIYNKKIKETFMQQNNFKDYQLYEADYLPRYSALLKKDERIKEKNQIIWFITWREYLGKNIETEVFIRTIKKIVSSNILKEYLEKNNLEFKICVHTFFDKNKLAEVYESIATPKISIVSQPTIDIMDELAKSKLLITDYSSIGFDFTFLNKPVLLFQPDREAYLTKRKIYCEKEELQKASLIDSEELIEKIINGNYKINEFLRSRLPDNIDYDYVREEKHIEKMYKDFSHIQNNKITFIGYNFYGVGGTVNATRALAEGLLEKNYLVELLSLKKTKKMKNMPFGLNVQYIFYKKTKSLREKVIRNLFRKKKNYSFLKYDSNMNLLHPYVGYVLNKLMKNIKTNTLISTRESLHLFLNECKSEYVKQKIYFFHCPEDNVETLFPGVLNKIKQTTIDKAIFVTEKNRLAFKNKLNYENYSNYTILGNALEQYKILKPQEITAIQEKEKYKAIYLLRISKDRIEDLNNLIEFGIYMKKNNVKKFVLDVYGTGDYVDEFADKLDENDIREYICYKGLTTNPIRELRNHDVMVDLSVNHSFGMTYIEAILNGKKVFCMKNPGSLEVMQDIPNSYINSFEDLVEKITNINKISSEELVENYKKIQNKYSRKIVTEKFIEFLNK